MRAGARATDGYVVAAMVVSAAAGRLLDTAGVLPGVHEAAAVRGGTTGWTVALVGGAVLGAAALATRVRAGLRATAWVVALGQIAVFFAAEGTVRAANGLGAFDPDGAVGAALQAAVGLLLLVALTVAWVVALTCGSLRSAWHGTPSHRLRARTATPLPAEPAVAVVARGPPRAMHAWSPGGVSRRSRLS